MRLRRRYVLAAALLGVMAASLSASWGSEIAPTVEAVNVGLYSHAWSPTQVSVASGGNVVISNPTSVPHGVKWVAGPGAPICESGVPVGSTSAASGKEWSGSCKFTQAGTYTFYCTVHGAEMTGTVTVTTPGAPTLTTGAASSVGQTEATLEGSVNPQKKATTYHFDYGTTSGYGHETADSPAGEGEAIEPVSAALNGLTAGVTYHYRLVAQNEAGTVNGADRTFTTTPAPGAPGVTTGAASPIAETSATLTGTIDPDGQATEYRFEWGTTSSYGNVTSLQAIGSEDHAVHSVLAALSGLLPGTAYHYRLVAKNASGSAPGQDHEFVTHSPAPAPETTVPPTTTPTSSTPAPAPSSPVPAGPSITPPPAPTKVLSAPLLGALKLTVAHHGPVLKGTLEAGAGGRLEIDLIAKSSAIGRSRSSKGVLVGRLVRSSVTAGRLSFSLSLTASAKRALKRHKTLKVSVKAVLTPKQGAPASVGANATLRL